MVLLIIQSHAHAQSGEIPLDPRVLPIVVKIETLSERTKKPSYGTGFIVGREISLGSSKARAYFLVTNKHMISDWTLADGDIKSFNIYIDVHFYKEGSSKGSQLKRTELFDANGNIRPDVHAHDNPLIDIAIVFLNRALKGTSDLYLPAFDVSYLRPFNAITSANFNIGSQVFVLGYPLGITSVGKNYPIAKFGFIASMPGEKFALDLNVKNRAGKKSNVRLAGKLLIIDGLIVPGNSGGPVILPSIIKTRIDPETKKFQHWTKPSENQVIGILAGGFRSSGLSYSYCSDYIIAAIDQFLANAGLNATGSWP
jgi:hypothetical protein